MAPELVNITRSLSLRAHGSSTLPDGLSDGSMTGERSTHGKEAIRVPSRGRSCTQ